MRDDIFNPCTNCPNKKDTSRIKVILTDGGNNEKYFLLLTPDQVKLLKFLKENCIDFYDDNTNFDVIEDYEDWEEI